MGGFGGLGLAALFTLYVTPAAYLALAHFVKPRAAEAARREGVSAAAHRLRQAGLIRYRCGQITIVDHVGLEGTVCYCYQVVRTEYDRPSPPR